jgi:prolipoprotein diacylglyceryltransferase
MTQPRVLYALFMLLALAAFALTRRMMAKEPAIASLSSRQRMILGIAAFIGAMFGAKLPFVLSGGAAWDADRWLADGKTLTTGLAGAYLAVELTKWMNGIRIKTGDGFALPLAVAMAVGRWGCFFGGCCYGVHTSLPWGVDFHGDGPRHPTQIYESLFHATMAVVLIAVARRGTFRFQRLKLYLIAYCAFRFLTEYIRPATPGPLGLTYYQWVVLIMALALLLQWLSDRRLHVFCNPPLPTVGSPHTISV